MALACNGQLLHGIVSWCTGVVQKQVCNSFPKCVLQVLSSKEIEWVNAYHREVWEKVSPRLQSDKDLLAWVKQNTQPL